MSEEEGSNRGSQSKVVLWVCAVLVSINISCLGFLYGVIRDLELAVATIQANRFTASDAAAIYEKFAGIERRLAEFPKETPPPLFRDYVKENRRRIERIEERAR